MVDCGMKLVKYLLFFFNFLFVLSGLAILICGIVVQFAYKDYLNFVGDAALSAPILLIIVGVIIFLVAFFGCCGAIKENQCMVLTYAVLLTLIFILELAAGIVAYVYQDKVDDFVKKNMDETLENYGNPESEGVTKTWDLAQHDLKCCGIIGPFDWKDQSYMHGPNLPKSCCITISENCGKNALATNEVDSNKYYTLGCYESLKDLVEDKVAIVGGVGIGIAFIQLVGIVFACCFHKALKRDYDTV